MSRTFKVYQGEDLSPVYDLTEPTSPVHVIWEEVEAGGRAYKGESTLSSIPVRDERGETGSSASLPANLSYTGLPRGSRIEWMETDSNGTEHRMFRGRIGAKDYRRGRQLADRAREVTISAADTNEDLRNIIVDGWDRPEETDIARAQHLLTDYLSGDPRVTTNISDTYLAAGSNAVTLGPRVYDATNPADILAEIAAVANKLHFVTIDDELFYDGWDSRTYSAGIRISDRHTEWSTDNPADIPIVDLPAHPTIATPNGDFEAGPSGNPNGVLNWADNGGEGLGGVADSQLASGDPSGSGGVYYAEVNTLSPIWAYYGWGSTVFKKGVTYTVSAWVNTLSYVYFGDIAAGDWVQGQADDGGGVFTQGIVILSWTPSADRSAVRLVQNLNANGPTAAGSGDLLIDQVLLLDTAALRTFPPIWDVGPSSTEDGMQLLSGLRLYYGQGSNTYVYINHPSTANEYWHSEESLYTNDPLIDTATKATRLATSILAHRRYEERTYNVSIGPLDSDDIAFIKPGQIIDIKARAIPDADDAYVSRRIAQLRWTTPAPGVFFAHMQLDRPMKEVAYGVGPKSATDSINRHVEQGSNSHPEYVLRGTLISQGDLPYRGASDWTRLPIGSSNTRLASDGVRPLWVPKDAASGSGIAVEEDGVEEGTGIDRLDFTGDISVAVAGTQATINVTASGGASGYDPDAAPSGISFQQEMSGAHNGTWTTTPATEDDATTYDGIYAFRHANTTEHHLSWSWAPGASDITIACKVHVGGRGTSNDIGLVIGDATGNPTNALMIASNPATQLKFWNETGGGFAQVGVTETIDPFHPLYIAIQRTIATNTWEGFWSFDGIAWESFSATTTKTMTVAAVAFRVLSDCEYRIAWVRGFASKTLKVGA